MLDNNLLKKEEGAKLTPNDSAKNQLQYTKYTRTSYQTGLNSSSKSIILTRKEIQKLLSNSIKSFNKIIVSENTRFASILKKKRKIIENGFIKNDSK